MKSGQEEQCMLSVLHSQCHICWCSGYFTVYPKKYAHGFVVLCFVVVMQSFIMNSHEVLIHIHQGCFAGTGAIVRLPQCQWNKPDGYGKISQCITTTKHSKAKTVCIFLGIYCRSLGDTRHGVDNQSLNIMSPVSEKSTLSFHSKFRKVSASLWLTIYRRRNGQYRLLLLTYEI